MTESDSVSSSLMLKAREILASPSLEGLESIVGNLYLGEKTFSEYQKTLTLYKFCIAQFPNVLTLMLLKIYRESSPEPVNTVRFQSIDSLLAILSEFKKNGFLLDLVTLKEIKPLLISCLAMEETKEYEIMILKGIVSFVAYNVISLDNEGLDDLSDCIRSFAYKDPLKAFHVFNELPPVYAKFIVRVMDEILEKAYRVLCNPKSYEVAHWSLCLQTFFKMVILFIDSEMTANVIEYVQSNLVKSVIELLVMEGLEELLVKGLEDLEQFLERDKILCSYSKDQCCFVSNFMLNIRALGKEINKAATKILDSMNSLEISKIIASSYVEEKSIRRLNFLLSDDTWKIDVSLMRKLEQLLVTWLMKQGISDSLFKVLGETVYHVSSKMMNVRGDQWYGLRDYIVSKGVTEFERAVYIYQCWTMWVGEESEEFISPMMDILLPEIKKRLNPPSELCVDNSGWVLTFVGAFCAVIHLVDNAKYRRTVMEIEEKMVESVRELVERKMEVGLVRRAFSDVESIVKKEKGWFSMNVFGFIKCLLSSLCGIKTMQKETRIVLWRINVFVDRGINELAKFLPA